MVINLKLFCYMVIYALIYEKGGWGMNQFDIPVLFCTFNRLECTKRVFERIREVKPAKMYLVSDGPRENIVDEEKKVNSIRRYLDEHVDWDCQIYKNYAEKNMGCGKRMSSGISWAFEQEEKLIIIEDDCLPDLSFFRYCEELLELYKEDENIMLIGGSNSIEEMEGEDSFVFTPYLENWGWATWKRTWEKYDYDILSWEGRKIPPYMKTFMSDKAIDFYARLFYLVYTHELDTWDYQLQYLIFQQEALTIAPQKCLVKNIGFGPDATHTKTKPDKLYSEDHRISFPMQIPSCVKNNEEYTKRAFEALI